MENMPNIKLSENDLKILTTRRIYSSGGESYICQTSNYHTLYKIFRRGSKIAPMSQNKQRKIERLHQMSLKNSIQPLSTISCNGELIGYEMTYDPQDVRFYPPLFDRENLINYLKEAKDILEYFAENDITYGDVNFRNILFNRRTGEIKFCDMDNIRIGEYRIDLLTQPLKKYCEARGIDEATDAYMHSLLTLKALGLHLLHSDSKEFSLELEQHAVDKIIPALKEPKLFEGEYIIQYVKKKKG